MHEIRASAHPPAARGNICRRNTHSAAKVWSLSDQQRTNCPSGLTGSAAFDPEQTNPVENLQCDACAVDPRGAGPGCRTAHSSKN